MMIAPSIRSPRLVMSVWVEMGLAWIDLAPLTESIMTSSGMETIHHFCWSV